MASFMFYDLIFLALFCIFVVLFLYKRRKRLGREGVMFLYRTKVGLKIIDYFGKKHAKFIGYVEYVVMACGYLLMATSLYFFYKIAYMLLKSPDIFKVVKIPPIAPLIPYFGEIFKADYLPPLYFTYWIVILAVTAILHEFFHGIFARKNNVRIKSTGFAFLGPFFGAFVEQDEKDMKKAKPKSQMSILAAGSFANLLITILSLILFMLFNLLAYSQQGAIFNYYSYNKISVSEISWIDNSSFYLNFDGGLNLTRIISGNKTYFAEARILGSMQNQTEIIVFDDAPAIKSGLIGAIIEFDGNKIKNNDDLKKELSGKSPGDEVVINTVFDNSIKSYSITLGKRPDNVSQAYLGVVTLKYQSSGIFGSLREKISFFRDPSTYYAPKYLPELTIFIYNLLWWLILINLSVAVFNMFPAWIFDGGRFFYLMLLRTTKSKKIAEKSYKIMTYLFLAFVLLLTLFWIVYTFFV